VSRVRLANHARRAHPRTHVPSARSERLDRVIDRIPRPKNPYLQLTETPDFSQIRKGRTRAPSFTMSKALAKMFEPMFASMAKRYQSVVGAELSKYGLRYDDLLDETANLDVAEALRRLPQEERDLRMQRLKRAMDLSMKHVYLDKEMQAKQTPLKWYIQPVLEEVEAERDERAALGTGQPYNR
jgi:ubiquinol-cytochrome c reductase subunit 7